MKITRQLPEVTAITPQERREPLRTTRLPERNGALPAESAQVESKSSKSTSFSLQLNQQLTSMQSAESYLDELHTRLSQLKLSLSRQISASTAGGEDSIRQSVKDVNELLDQRSKRSAQSLDANFKLRLNEPVRSRFTLQGLESLEQIRQAAPETLLFSAGRQLSEPVAVVLDEGMTDEQILRRFNGSLGQAGIRAELDDSGQLRFTAREAQWQNLKPLLAVQGEGNLFPRGKYVHLPSQDEQLFDFTRELQLDSFRELRRLLDDVVAGLDKIAALRDQLASRQREIREFLDRQADADEKQWAADFSRTVFNLMHRSPSSYAAVTQTVVAQATLSRFAVVSLLS